MLHDFNTGCADDALPNWVGNKAIPCPRREVAMRVSLLIVPVVASLCAAPAVAQLEHPVVKPIQGFVLDEGESSVKTYGGYDFAEVDSSGETNELTKKGKLWHLEYLKPGPEGEPDESFSEVEIVDNYVAAVKEIGGQILVPATEDELQFSVPRSDGGITYAFLLAEDGSYTLDIVDEKPLERSLEFARTTADEMHRGLEQQGSVAVYGILFATDSAELQVGAATTLEDVVKVLQANPKLKVEVQGHTDNTGSAEHNLELSRRRAATVAQYLELYGISADRLTTQGYGETRPLADNSTEAGRAKNRRVELVKVSP